MDERASGRRVVLCGSPGAGKKRLLHALAQCRCASGAPVVLSATGAAPVLVSWKTQLDHLEAVYFETLHGPGFYYENAVADFLASPACAVVYVLAQSHPRIAVEESWHGLEVSSFHTYSSAAAAHRNGWHDVPWLFIRLVGFPDDLANARWATHLIPAECPSPASLVDSGSGRGVTELFRTIEEATRQGASRR